MFCPFTCNSKFLNDFAACSLITGSGYPSLIKLIVSNLYNTFLERLVPTEMQGYNKVASKDSAILEVRV